MTANQAETVMCSAYLVQKTMVVLGFSSSHVLACVSISKQWYLVLNTHLINMAGQQSSLFAAALCTSVNSRVFGRTAGPAAVCLDILPESLANLHVSAAY